MLGSSIVLIHDVTRSSNERQWWRSTQEAGRCVVVGDPVIDPS
jgi:hypothetical protein